MEPFYNENDEKLRLKRDKNRGKFTVATFINWWLIPGFIGMVIAVFGKFAVHMVSYMPRNETLERSVTRALDTLATDFAHLASLDWGKTNMWSLLLFGFILGVFIKYAYTDKKIS